MTAIQDANVNGKCVQVIINSIDGVSNIDLFNAVTAAMNAVITQYENKLDKDIDYSAYIMDKDNVAIY
jgi:hypothetical protein